MTEPLVSIIIPVYNSAKHLAETIESAINQTWSNKEILLIDDGSTDNSLAIAKSYENSWIKIFHQQNSGASTARNYGLRESNGKYIQFLDADDLISNNKIANQIDVLNDSDEYISLCATIHFKESSEIINIQPNHDWYQIGSDNPFDFLIKLYSHDTDIKGYGGMVAIHSWLTPRKLIDKAGFWNEALNVDDDGEFFCRVVLSSTGLKYSYKGICYYRHFLNGNNLSSKKSLTAYNSMVNALNLKYHYLTSAGTHPLLKQIMARHYWWIGVSSYPQYKTVSRFCIQKTEQLGFKRRKYNGGKKGMFISRILGWKITRIIGLLKNGF